MFDGILFDLDGTLWDSTPAIRDTWNRARDNHPELTRPPVTVEEVRASMGLLVYDIARKLFPEGNPALWEALIREEDHYMTSILSDPGASILYPQVEATLDLLRRRAKLFLVSNCGEAYFEAFYAAHGLRKYFTGDLNAGRTGRPKSENIAQVVREYGLERPVYIGDTVLDADSAREAGVAFLHAAYGFGQVEGASAVRCFADIPRALERL